jgi:hypothetical protein
MHHRRRSAILGAMEEQGDPMPISVDLRVFIANPPSPIETAQQRTSTELEQQFRTEVERWKDETQHSSSMPRIVSHPSHLRIIGLAAEFGKKKVEKLILQELEADPYHWFDALEAITGKNPVKPEDDFDAAVNAWLEWGRQEGVIANDNTTGA